MDAQNAMNKIRKNVCMKCKHVDRNPKCSECRECEYNFAIDAIVKAHEYEKVGLSPSGVRKVLAEKNSYAFQAAKYEMGL